MNRTFTILFAVITAVLVPMAAFANRYVVDQAGGGDFTTIQAALDAMGTSYVDDTTIVHAGQYGERLTFVSDSDHDYLICPSGSDSTTVTGVSTHSYLFALRGTTVQGLSVTEAVVMTPDLVSWQRCAFRGGFSEDASGRFSDLTDCDFYGPVSLSRYHSNARPGLTALRFHHAPVTVTTGGGAPTILFDCEFHGAPEDTLLRASSGADELTFENCWFDSGAVGVYTLHTVTQSFSNCSFSDLGIAFYAPNLPATSGMSPPLVFPALAITNCAVHRCATLLAWSRFGDLGMTADTISDCTTPILVSLNPGRPTDTATFQMTNCLLSDFSSGAVTVSEAAVAAGRGIVRLNGNTFTHNGAAGAVVSAGTVQMSRNVFSGNDGPGAAITLTSAAAVDSVTLNTFALNTGDGVSLGAGVSSTPSGLAVTRNVSAQNAGAGFRYLSPMAGSFIRNDSWQNYGPGYVGFTPAISNLVVDPRFCDLINGDLTVSADSPCAPSASTGPMGALGVGCDPASLGVGPSPATTALTVSPSPARGLVEFSLPRRMASGRIDVLDAQGRRVWSANVAAGSGPVHWRGEQERGGAAKAGIYWARVTRGTETQSRRFVWLK